MLFKENIYPSPSKGTYGSKVLQIVESHSPFYLRNNMYILNNLGTNESCFFDHFT